MGEALAEVELELEAEKSQLSLRNMKIAHLEKQLELTQEKVREQQEIIAKNNNDREELLLVLRTRESEVETLRQQIEHLQDEIGKHELNSLEQEVVKILSKAFNEESVLTQFDVALPGTRSKITDFIVGLENFVAVIEAKNYSGRIVASNPRNDFWYCQAGTRSTRINTCWGKNPYLQVKSYCDSLSKKSKFLLRRSERLPTIYGLIVFPDNSDIDSNLKSEFNNGSDARDKSLIVVVNLRDMVDQLRAIDTRSKDRSSISGKELIEKLCSNL